MEPYSSSVFTITLSGIGTRRYVIAVTKIESFLITRVITEYQQCFQPQNTSRD